MGKVNIKPLGTRVLIQVSEAEEKTASGLYIPNTAQEKPQKGVVIAVGNGTKDEEMQLKEGDTVIFGKYSGTEITLEGTKYLMMKQDDIMAII